MLSLSLKYKSWSLNMEFAGVRLTVSCPHCQQIVEAMIRQYDELEPPQIPHMAESPAFQQERITEMFGHRRSKRETPIKIPRKKILAYDTVVDHINELKGNGYLEEIYDSQNNITLLALNESKILCDYIKRIGYVPEEMYDFQTHVIWDFITSVREWRNYLKAECSHCGKEVKPKLQVKKEVASRNGEYVLKETGELVWRCSTHYNNSKKLIHMKKIDTYFE